MLPRQSEAIVLEVIAENNTKARPGNIYDSVQTKWGVVKSQIDCCLV
jgi:hypothetical protein